jgi:hypothetical protein
MNPPFRPEEEDLRGISGPRSEKPQLPMPKYYGVRVFAPYSKGLAARAVFHIYHPALLLVLLSTTTVLLSTSPLPGQAKLALQATGTAHTGYPRTRAQENLEGLTRHPVTNN